MVSVAAVASEHCVSVVGSTVGLAVGSGVGLVVGSGVGFGDGAEVEHVLTGSSVAPE